MIKYVFRDNVNAIKGADKADPQRIGEALAKIADQSGGQLTPAAVVEAASAPCHVLHRHFEWDDAAAAQQWRLDQARNIIRSIHAEDDDADEGHAPAFISIADKGGVSYRSLGEVKGSADLQARVLAAAERDLEAWERRFRALTDVCKIVATARDAIRAKAAKVKNRPSE